MMQSVENFKPTLTVCQAPMRPTSIRRWLQVFHTTKVIASNVQNCCSDEDSSTVPWCFFSSFIIFLFSFIIPLKGKKILKECVNKLVPSASYGTQKLCLLAVNAINKVLYLIMLPTYRAVEGSGN